MKTAQKKKKKLMKFDHSSRLGKEFFPIHSSCSSRLLHALRWCYTGRLACSRRLDSRARKKNLRRKKNEGRLEGGRGREPRSHPPPPPSRPPLVFTVYNLTRSPMTATLSEPLEQATGRYARTIFSGKQRCNNNNLERFFSMFNKCPAGISSRRQNPEETL